MEILSKIAAILVALMLYFVIALLQLPKPARAAERTAHTPTPHAAIVSIVTAHVVA